MQMTTWGFGKTAALFGLAGVLLALVASLAMPVSYASQAVVRIVGKDADVEFMQDLVGRTLTRNALTTAIENCGLYPSERSTKPMEDVVKIKEARIVMRLLPPPAAPNSVQVQFLYEDRLAAQTVVKRLVAPMIDENVRGPVSSSPHIVELLDPPSLPQRPVSPARRNVMAMGLSGGILAAALVAALRHRARVRPV